MMSIVRLAYASATTLSLYVLRHAPLRFRRFLRTSEIFMDIMATRTTTPRSGGLDFSHSVRSRCLMSASLSETFAATARHHASVHLTSASYSIEAKALAKRKVRFSR